MANSKRLLLSLLLSCGILCCPCRGQDAPRQLHSFSAVPDIDIDSLYHILSDSELLARSHGAWKKLAADSSCLRAWQQLQHVKDAANISIVRRMLDATGKPGAGILNGNIYAYGSFQECLDTGVSQYCIVPLNLTSVSSNKTLFYMRLAVCMPKVCRPEDISDAIEALDNILHIPAHGLVMNLQIPDPANIVCQSKETVSYRPGAIVIITLSTLLVLLALLGTLVDFLLSLHRKHRHDNSRPSTIQTRDTGLEKDADHEPSESTPLLHNVELHTRSSTSERWDKVLDLVTAFSIYKTAGTILSTEESSNMITCINGIRVISMFWVIIFHIYILAFAYGGFDNMLWIDRNVLPRFSFQAVGNGTVSVDSFFFLSGLLVAYHTLRQMSKKKHWKVFLLSYIHRVIRLTPTYAYVLFFYWLVSVHLQPSPIYTTALSPGGPAYEACRSYWWTNLLYINNLYPWNSKDECMDWTWYLANDMQFFVVAPLMLVLLFWSLPVGLVSVAIFLFGSFAATGVIAGYYDFVAKFTPTIDTEHGAYANTEIYIKPYTRISPYLVGVVLGVVLFRKFKVAINRCLNLLIYAIIWSLAAFFCLSALYGEYGTWHGHPFSKAENVLFFMFHRFAWAVGLALLVFACHNGYGGAINRFLSMKIWTPLSRLTFCAYLVHPIVIIAIYGADVTPIHYTDVTISVYITSAVVLSYGAASVVAAFVEFPSANLEAAVLRLLGVRRRESVRLATREPPRSQLRLPA